MNQRPENETLGAKRYRLLQEAKCKKKRKFGSESAAELASKHTDKLTVYKCRCCDYWHLTSTGPPMG